MITAEQARINSKRNAVLEDSEQALKDETVQKALAELSTLINNKSLSGQRFVVLTKEILPNFFFCKEIRSHLLANCEFTNNYVDVGRIERTFEQSSAMRANYLQCILQAGFSFNIHEDHKKLYGNTLTVTW